MQEKVVIRVLIITYFLFSLTAGHAQTVWGELFTGTQGADMEKAYQSVSSGSQDNMELTQLISYVKTLNDYALLYFPDLNDTFQKKAISHIISTDSIQANESSGNINWWRTKFIRLIHIMPLYVIQKQTDKLAKPLDTLEIAVPGTDKVISVIVNNRVIQGYLLAQGEASSIADQELRFLNSDDVYDLIAYYRDEKELPTQNQTDNTQLLAENSDSVKGKTVVLADNTNNNQTDQTAQNNQNNTTNTTTNYRTNNNSTYNAGNIMEGVAFRVQIAAARRELSESELKQRYSGTREAKTFEEEGWIKYYVAQTADLSQAKKIKTEPGMPTDAFIMSYQNGQKAPQYLYSSFDPKPIRADNYLDLGPETRGNKIWVVQIAADQKALNMTDIRARYEGTMPIYYINEGVWHRYSIGIFNSFKEANVLRMSCGVPDAFVAAYLNNTRINTWASMKNPGKISKKPIRYIVQVAAAQNKLTDKEIKERYKGDKEIIYFQEDGYHKYAIGRFKTFKKALEEREKCGVPDAFIKAYRGNQKIDLIHAKSITD